MGKVKFFRSRDNKNIAACARESRSITTSTRIQCATGTFCSFLWCSDVLGLSNSMANLSPGGELAQRPARKVAEPMGEIPEA